MDKFEELIKELKEHNKGKENQLATEYENLCIRIIDVLFGEHFFGWVEDLKRNIENFAQLPIENEECSGKTFQKRDLVVPIRYYRELPEFWKFIYTALNSRYITFEFKNYSSPIRQNEIFTTEKYLYVKALRSVAIIFTREGVDKNGQFAIYGAIRENGKFILVLNDNDIIKMLQKASAGEDATDFLLEKIHHLLMKLPK